MTERVVVGVSGSRTTTLVWWGADLETRYIVRRALRTLAKRPPEEA